MVSLVKVYMTEKDALFAKWDEDRSQQGSSTKGCYPMARPSIHVGSSTGIRPSGAMLSVEDVKTDDLRSIESRGDDKLGVGELGAETADEPIVEERLGEGEKM